MRVAYLVNQYPKVSHSFIRREIQALERRGVEVVRWSIRPVRETMTDPEDAAEADRTRAVLAASPTAMAAAVARAKLTHPGDYLRALRTATKLGRRSEAGVARHLIYLAEACVLAAWARRMDVSHIHAHFGTNPATVALLTHLVTGGCITYSFTVHGPEEFDRPVALSLGEKIHHATFVAAISSFGRSQLYRWCDHDHWDRIEIVRCGLDSRFLGNHDAAPAADESEPSFVCVGRLCEQKGQLLLIEAAARLARSGARFRLVFVGDGEMRSAVQTLIAHHRLDHCVTITGWASGDQVRSHLLAARAMVLPSFAEGLPVAIMEAMALRRPVITTSIAGIPELVDSTCGWLIPAGSVDALVQAMSECLDQEPAALRLMGDVAAERIRERHDVDREAGRLATLFEVARSAPAHRRAERGTQRAPAAVVGVGSGE